MLYNDFVLWFCSVRVKSCQVAFSPFVIILRRLLKATIAELNEERSVKNGNVDVNSQQALTIEVSC